MRTTLKMRRIFSSVASLFLLTQVVAFASVVAFPFRVADNSGTLVPGATVAVGATTLTAGSVTTVPAAAGEKVLSTNTTPGSTVSVTLLDYGTGDYALLYDPTTQGELYIPLTVSKAGSTITGTNALVPLTGTSDSSLIAATNVTTTSTNTLASRLSGALTPITGAVNDASATTISFVTNLSSAVTDFYAGDILVFTSGANTAVSRHLSGFNGSTKAVTLLTPLPFAPANTDTFTLIPSGKRLTDFLAALGTDNKPVLSANTQPAITVNNLPYTQPHR